jgi:hypothetical protein
MTTIRLHRHPFASDPETYTANSIGEWLLAHYGERAPAFGVFVYAGQPSKETDITGNIEELLKNDAPLYVVLETPGDPTGGVLTSVLMNMLISTAISVIARSIFAPDEKPLENRTQESPNNVLTARQNRQRPLERVEDIFGTVRSFPTLLMPTYRKYIDHEEVEYGYYCVTRGYAAISDIKDGDTLLTSIEGASAAIYAPFTSPNSGAPTSTVGAAISDQILSVERSSSVDGIVLRAPNQAQIEQNLITYYFYRAGWEGGGGLPANPDNDMIYQPEGSRRPNFNAVAEPGQQITILSEDGSYNQVRTISEVADGYMLLAPAATDFAAWFGPEFLETTRAILTISGVSEWTDWYTLPQVGRTEVWANFVARNGLFRDDGTKHPTDVSFELQINRLDPATLTPTADYQLVSGTLSGATSRQRAETLENITSWVGPARVRARRSSDYDYLYEGAVQDEITWLDAYAVTPVTKAHFGNKTTIHTVTRATAGAAAIQRRQLNCLASRLLPIYNGAGGFSGQFDSSGALASGTLAATTRIIDIISAVTADPYIGNRPLTDLDLPQLWGIQQQLDAWHPNVGQFSYTFDTDQISYEETLNAVADAAFCKAYRQNGRIRLALDRPQIADVAIFTHRNKRPKAETISRKFANDSDYDGIEFVYADPESETQETIRLPLGNAFTKLKRIEVTGIRNFEQAWFRANREYGRLIYQRLSVEMECTADARALLPNARIGNVDNTRFRTFDGDVRGQDGLGLVLSTDVEFAPGLPHSIVLMRRDGSVESIAVTPGTAPNRVVLAAPPSEPLVTMPTPEEGIRTIFSFAADDTREAMTWLVQKIVPTEGGYMKVTAINYHPGYYAADALPVPARAAVIND